MSLISIAELQTLIRQRIVQDHTADTASETIPILHAAGRVLAQDIVSPVSLPPANVSAMDGYALPHAAPAQSSLKIVGESAAGKPFSGSLKNGECIRIMTGAIVPPCCTTVVMQENVSTQNGSITLLQDVPDDNNIRHVGEELQHAQRVFAIGRIMRDADIMMLAALGFAHVTVRRKLRVAVISTGDELAEPGQPAASNQIYDSNRYMLMSRLQRLPVDVRDMGALSDNLDATLRVLDEAAQQCDIVITSGGVSVGDYDFLRQAVETLGTIHHYKVAMKPGKPFVFGRLGTAWYFGLPGNPVSGFVGLDMFVRAALWQLAGVSEVPQPLRFQAALSVPVKKSAGRADIQRAVITRQTDGTWLAAPAGKQDSHRILGVSAANAYMILPEGCNGLAAGDTVEVQPFADAFL